MADDVTGLELDRWQVMKLLRAEHYSFPAMIPVLTQLGLLECQETHRFRIRDTHGDAVCVTCENTLLVYWRRGLARLVENMDQLEVKGAWIDDHQFIADTCRKNIRGKRHNTVTRTTEVVEMVEGKEVVTRNTVTTTSEEWRINVGLLKLLADVRDKMARVGGMNVDRPVIGDPAPDVEILFHELSGDGSDSAGDEPAN